MSVILETPTPKPAAHKASRPQQYTRFAVTVHDCPAGHSFYANIGEHTGEATMPKMWFKYCCAAPEANGERWHAQCYFHTNKPARFSQLIRWLINCDAPSSPHVEAAHGSHEQNVGYCSGMVEKKGNVRNPDFIEYGREPEQYNPGERETARWDGVKQAIQNGDWDAIPADILIRYAHNLGALETRFYRPLLESLPETCGEWDYGESGTGKSQDAIFRFPMAYRKLNNKWWDQYPIGGNDKQKVVVIEEVERDQAGFMLHFLKVWADRYPFAGEIKGGYIMLRPTKVVVCSNWAPWELWTQSQEIEPILRRFRVFHYQKNGEGHFREYVPNTGPGRIPGTLPGAVPGSTPGFQTPPVLQRSKAINPARGTISSRLLVDSYGDPTRDLGPGILFQAPNGTWQPWGPKISGIPFEEEEEEVIRKRAELLATLDENGESRQPPLTPEQFATAYGRDLYLKPIDIQFKKPRPEEPCPPPNTPEPQEGTGTLPLEEGGEDGPPGSKSNPIPVD